MIFVRYSNSFPIGFGWERTSVNCVSNHRVIDIITAEVLDSLAENNTEVLVRNASGEWRENSYAVLTL